MNKYTVGAILLGAILLLVMISTQSNNAGQAATKQSAASTIAVTGDKYDFGAIDIFGGKVHTTYTLKNEGSDDVTITNAQTSCMCTEGEIDGYTFGMHGSDVHNIVIPAGAEKKVTATFDPLAHGPNGTGKITRELVLKTNSTASPEVRMMFSGDVVKNENN